MLKLKENVTDTLKEMSDTKSLDEIFYTLYLKVKIARSEDDIKNGRVITLEEFDKEMEALYENYNIK